LTKDLLKESLGETLAPEIRVRMRFYPSADATHDARSLVAYDNVTHEGWTNFGVMTGLYVEGEFGNFGHEALLVG